MRSLAELRKLLESTTQGEWEYDESDGIFCAYKIEPSGFVRKGIVAMPATLSEEAGGEPYIDINPADAKFITETHNDFPGYLDRIDQAEAACAEMRGALEIAVRGIAEVERLYGLGAVWDTHFECDDDYMERGESEQESFVEGFKRGLQWAVESVGSADELRAALSSSAGKAMLARVKHLEAIAEAAVECRKTAQAIQASPPRPDRRGQLTPSPAMQANIEANKRFHAAIDAYLNPNEPKEATKDA